MRTLAARAPRTRPELAGAALIATVALASWVGFAIGARSTLLVAWLVPVVWAAVVDAREGRLPDRVVLSGLAFVMLATALTGDRDLLVGALVGAWVLGVPFALVHLLFPAGFGFGDVKYGVLLGLGLGLLRPALGVAVFVMAALVQLAVIVWRPWPAQRRAGWDRRAAPFGPALAVAAVGWAVAVVLSGGGV